MHELLILIYGYLRGMWRYRWQALFFAWGVALVGWLYVFSLPNQYSAKAVVYIDTTSIMKPLLRGLALETDADNEINVMSRVLLSRENLLSVIRETDMDLEAGSPAARELLVQELANSIVLKGGERSKWSKREPTSDIYEISYQGGSADHVYQVVSKLLNTMIEGRLYSNRTDTVAAQKFLDDQIAEYEQRLSIAEQNLADFKKANVGFMPDEKGGYYARLQAMQAGVDNSRSELRLARQRYSELRKQLQGEAPLLGSASYQPAFMARLRQYEEDLEVLLNQYTEQHPDVQALQSTIADLKARQANGETATAAAETNDVIEFNPVYQDLKFEISKASVEIETLKVRLAEQESHVEKLKASIDIIPEVEANLAKLDRDYQITKKRYLDLVDRRESARLAQDAGQSSSDISFRVIEPPIMPSRPSGPRRLLLLAGVCVAAIGAGLGWGLLRYLLLPTFIDSRQVRSNIGLPVLGSVSLYLSPEHRKDRRLQLVTFLSVAVLFLGVFGAVLWYKDTGTALVGAIISGLKLL
jgi:polysaccharide chain length determinant protein (PEP-CTERM system associated)